MILDGVDLEILKLLTWRVRLATGTQLVEFSGSAARTRKLHVAGLLAKDSTVAAVPTLVQPLAIWLPGQEAPDFQALAWKLLQRRRSTRPKRVRVFWATKRAVQISGGVGGRIRQPVQVEHDLGTTATFLRRRIVAPEEAERCVGEDIYRLQAARGCKVPDALLCSATGAAERAIEYGGAYAASRIRGFHRHCSGQKLAWEIW